MIKQKLLSICVQLAFVVNFQYLNFENHCPYRSNLYFITGNTVKTYFFFVCLSIAFKLYAELQVNLGNNLFSRFPIYRTHTGRVTLADKQAPNWRRKAIVLQSAACKPPAVVRDPWFPSVPVMDVFILAITPLCYSTVSRQRDQNNSPEQVSTPLRWRGEIYSPVCPHTHWTCSPLIGRCGSCDFT